MPRYLTFWLLLALAALSLGPLTAQTEPPAPETANVPPPRESSAPTQVNTAPTTPVNPPPFNQELLPTKTGLERNLAWGVLAFGTVITLAMIWFLGQRTKHGSVEDMTDAMKYPVVLVIIVSSLFLVTGGYGNAQITPIIGLLGTVAGYVLGRSKVTK